MTRSFPMLSVSALFLALSLSACDGLTPGTPNPTPSASSSSSVSGSVNANVMLPDPAEIASFTNFKAVSCDQEGTLKSGTAAASKITVNNKTDATIKLYWLDFTGKRVEYSKGGIKAGGSHNQATYVTHPWLIANQNEECLGIYVPDSPSGAVLNVNKTVEVVGSGSVAGSVTGNASASFNKQQFINLMQCYKQKAPATAASVDVVLANINNIPDSAFKESTFALQINAAKAAGCVI